MGDLGVADLGQSDARKGLDEGEHGPGCPCTRCRGFVPGNEVAVKHAAYVGLRADLSRAIERLGPEVVEEAETIRSLVPGYCESDELAVSDLAVTRVRIKRAAA